MDEQAQAAEMDRKDAMLVLYGEGYTFADMVAPLQGLGLVTCQTDHRVRSAPHGKLICATCENTIYVTWRRHLKSVGLTRQDLDEARGEWVTLMQTVENICRERYIQEVVVTTTRTEKAEGADIVTVTERKETQINTNLLRLMCDVRDRMTRMAGVNTKNPASGRRVPRRLLVYERQNDPLDHGDGPSN